MNVFAVQGHRPLTALDHKQHCLTWTSSRTCGYLQGPSEALHPIAEMFLLLVKQLQVHCG